MEETEVLATPSVESPAVETASQEVVPASQEDAQPQETEQPKVEGLDNKPQVPEAPRLRPSDFHRQRERMRRQEESISSMSRQMQEMATLIKKLQPPEATGVQSKFEWDKFLTNPDDVLTAREKRFQDQIAKLEGKISNWETSQTQSEQNKNEQEALEILFPKAGPDDKTKWEERALSNRDRGEALVKLLQDTGLAEFSKVNPKLAAKLALKEFEEQTKPGPTVLKKTLMGGNARGGAGQKPVNAIESKRQELKRLNDETDKNPELRFDEKHRAAKDQVLREIERLAKE